MMVQTPGIVRRVYDAIAFVALINIVLLGASVAYLSTAGILTGARLRQMGMVLRGVPLAASRPADAGVPTAAGPSRPNPVAETDSDIEIAFREAERIKTELEQRLALSNSILLKVRAEREAFERQREAARKHDEAAAQSMREEGFRKQVAILESLAPKVAIQHLLAIADVDEAAKVLTAMDTAKAKKIVESAKRGEEMTKMKTILQRVREVAPTRLADLDGNEE
jgi:hypothetical protein